MDKNSGKVLSVRNIVVQHDSIELAASTPGRDVAKPGPHLASMPAMDRLSRIDGLHVIPALSGVLPVRLYAAAPLTELPSTLFPYLFATAEQRNIPKGTMLVEAENNRLEYLAVLEGELEVQRENVSVSGADEFQIGRLMKSAGSKAIVLLHTIPRRSSVRALTAVRVIRLDSERVEALRGWMLRCDARRKPGKFRH